MMLEKLSAAPVHAGHVPENQSHRDATWEHYSHAQERNVPGFTRAIYLENCLLQAHHFQASVKQRERVNQDKDGLDPDELEALCSFDLNEEP